MMNNLAVNVHSYTIKSSVLGSSHWRHHSKVMRAVQSAKNLNISLRERPYQFHMVFMEKCNNSIK